MGSFVSLSYLLPSYGHWNVENSSFSVFSANNSKKLVTVWAIFLSASKDLIYFFQQMVLLIGFGVTIREILKVET